MINRSLNIAAVPLPIVRASRQANFAAVEVAMSQIRPDTDLVVLPELFSTGFISDADTLRREAEPSDGPAMQLMSRLARRYHMAIAGSFLAKNSDAADASVFNRAFLMEPSGEVTFYDKRHLFSLSPESTLLKAGNKPMPIVRYRGWNIALAVCYDLRFPVWCRNRNMHYDVVLLPSNWPSSRGYAFRHLLIGRAIENQAWFVGADCSGSDEYGCYDGMTVIVDHEGTIVAQSSSESPAEPVYSTADREQLELYRRRMPAWTVADQYKLLN
ncbi:MAG: nitrilase family protein [Muribaculaceae bacterium]|nr:nitrilase family protein [Muribaculaceae bacterium]